jgi:acyl-CoA synthetase (NDP forming)
MYLESFGNPRKFTQLAREVSQEKPIIVVKSGRTASGARAASSHTGALAQTDMAFDALFRQCGVIRANTIEEMFDISMAIANQPIPKGNRVGIVTNAGGPGIMAADACESLNLKITDFTEKTMAKLRDYLPPEASIHNPVDLIASGDEDAFQYALDQVLQDEHVDAAIVIFVPPIFTDPLKVAQKISGVANRQAGSGMFHGNPRGCGRCRGAQEEPHSRLFLSGVGRRGALGDGRLRRMEAERTRQDRRVRCRQGEGREDF